MADLLNSSLANIVTPPNGIEDVIVKLGSIGLWLQAIGLIVVLWLIIQIINWIMNAKRMKKFERMEERLERIEKKVDRALKR